MAWCNGTGRGQVRTRRGDVSGQEGGDELWEKGRMGPESKGGKVGNVAEKLCMVMFFELSPCADCQKENA